VNGIPDDKGKRFWDGFICMDRQMKFRQVWILGEHETERALSQIGINLPIQIIDVLLGPVNFSHRRGEGVKCHV